jgi:hypothetical protein
MSIFLSDVLHLKLKKDGIYLGQSRPYLVRSKDNIIIGVGPSSGWTNPKKLPEYIPNLKFNHQYDASEMRTLLFKGGNILHSLSNEQYEMLM